MPTFQNISDSSSFDSIQQLKKPKNSLFNKVLTAIIIIILILVSYFLYLVVSTSGQVFQPSENDCKSWFCNIQNGFSNVPKIFSPDKVVKGQDEGRTNFLVIGADNTGSNGLTDTIIIASLYHTSKKIVTVNIPRDFLVSYRNDQFKINELYGRAELLQKNSGANQLAGFLSKEFEIPIHYWALTNFNGTKQLINTVGELDVAVEKSFEDCEYPNETYGYLPCQKFQAGLQKMNGSRALIYSRSRHGDNGEGSDFARSKRQSIVIQSTLQKLKSQNLFDNITKLSDFLKIFGDNARTNIDVSELKSLYNTLKGVDLKEDFLKVNWAVGNGILCDDSSADSGYYINYCGDEVAGSSATTGKSRYKAKTILKNLLVEAQTKTVTDNSVYIVGNGAKSANKIYSLLEDFGFDKIEINNQFTRIPVTPTPEKVSVLVRDPRLINLVRTALDKKIDYTIVNIEPKEFSLPLKSAQSKIVIFVE